MEEPDPMTTETTVITISLGELADRLGAELVGNPLIRVDGVAGIETAEATQITFVANPRYTGHARTTRAAAILVDRGFPLIERPTLRLANPYLGFALALEIFHRPPQYSPEVHSTAVIAPSAVIGARAHIAAYVVIMEDVVIGDDAVILPHAVIYPGARIGHSFLAHAHAIVREQCHLGDNVTLQNGAVIGSDGFGFARETTGGWHKIVQSAPAILEDDVEVQANACIDRASLGETRVGRGSKVDNLVQVGHGSTIGQDSLLCAQVGLAGSTIIGDRVILAGQVGVAGHCTVGSDVVATAQSGIPGDVPAGLTVSGYPAMENRRWLKTVALLNRLPDLVRNLKITQR